MHTRRPLPSRPPRADGVVDRNIIMLHQTTIYHQAATVF